jgi:NAD(P)-dependent dehydrogenase (short-subunit alcohol dehydrogenase family)
MRDHARATDLKAACEEAEVHVEPIVLDVTSESSVRHAVEQVLATTGGTVDVLVNNAAVVSYTPVEFTSAAEITAMVDTNLVGPIRMIKAVLPVMRRQGRGRIVNVGSSSAEPKFGTPLMAIYSATKAGLHTLSLDINKELAPLGIEVILCEGGIGGRSASLGSLLDGVGAFGHADGAYSAVEGCARGFAAYLDENIPVPHASGAIVADACLTEHPDLRHPAKAQKAVDAAHAITDTDYFRLCEGTDVAALVETLGAPAAVWTLGRLDGP